MEDLIAQRELQGISYLTIPSPYIETFAPIVSRLAGR
jgi:hypothetical protein